MNVRCCKVTMYFGGAMDGGRGGWIFRTPFFHFLKIFGKKASTFAFLDEFLNAKPNEIL